MQKPMFPLKTELFSTVPSTSSSPLVCPPLVQAWYIPMSSSVASWMMSVCFFPSFLKRYLESLLSLWSSISSKNLVRGFQCHKPFQAWSFISHLHFKSDHHWPHDVGAFLWHLDFKLHPLSNHNVIVVHELGDSHWGLLRAERGRGGLRDCASCSFFYTFSQHK